MPAFPGWYDRVAQILEMLEDPAAPPFVDRPAVERLFQVSRRQAIRLMGQCGGYQVGRTFLVDRHELTEFLEGVLRSGGPAQVSKRKRRVLEAVSEAEKAAAARQAQIRPNLAALEPKPMELPRAVERVAPGKLQITYEGAEDLLARVAELAASATKDFPRFQRLVEGEE